MRKQGVDREQTAPYFVMIYNIFVIYYDVETRHSTI